MKADSFVYKTTEARIIEVPVPEPAKDEVLVKVKYSALDTALDPVINKTSEGGYVHKFTTPHLFCAWHYSGTVEKVGSAVQVGWKVGDAVYGHLQYTSTQEQGSLAEYITVKEDACAAKPPKVADDLAAASATECLTALQGLCANGGLKEGVAGQSVLINGAAGGVGIAAVQIAKKLGVKVTAICSTKDVERITKLGADVIIDRTKTPNVLAELELAQFDAIFDTPSVLPVTKCFKYLKPKGNYVLTSPYLGLAWGMFVSLFNGKKVKIYIVESKKSDLELLGPWLEDGLEVDIDSTYPVKDIEKAAERNRDRKKKGRVVVQVDGGW